MTTRPCVAAALAMAFTVASAVSAYAYEEVAEFGGGGAITGQVTFHGAVPKRTVIPNKDVDVCGAPREDALLDVGPDAGVAGTLIYIVDVAKGKPWPAPGKPPELDNVKCRFVPEMQVIRNGTIAVVNKDPVLHNTHGYYGRRTAFNTALPNQDQSVTAELLKTGTVRVDCDAHGWMEGWVFVRDNPYYAITGTDGKFSIGDIPPGTYNVVALQPYSVLVEQNVTVAAGQAANLSIELKPQ